MLWIKVFVDKYGVWLMVNWGKVDVELRIVLRVVVKMRDEIRWLVDDNVYMVEYLIGQVNNKVVQVGKGFKIIEWNVNGDLEVKVLLLMQKEVMMDNILEEESEGEWIGIE